MTVENNLPEDHLLDAAEELQAARKKLAAIERDYDSQQFRAYERQTAEAQEEINQARVKFNATLRTLLQPIVRDLLTNEETS